jgi:uncharacterized protein (TIGR02646 family)
MRRLGARPNLSAKVRRLLALKTNLIVQALDPKSTAETIYSSSRKAKWFSEITGHLKSMSGVASRCMFCSGSEASNVEHFWPKSLFPQMAMTWANFFWACGICNQAKGDTLPNGANSANLLTTLIDPTADNVWDFCFIDEYGNLTARWNTNRNSIDPRADATIKAFRLDRELLQVSRQSRLADLKEKATDSLALLMAGQLTVENVRERIDEWKRQPFQPDVADFFLAGPGSSESPFSDLLARV